MKLYFFGGINEIGGNKILVDIGQRILLDFGMSFSKWNRFFDEYMKHREGNAMEDLIEMGLLPTGDIWRGIYREDYLMHRSIKPSERYIDGIFISQAHADHSSYLHYIRDDIPVYMSDRTKVIMEAMNETSSETRDYFEVFYRYRYTFSKDKAKKKKRKGDEHSYVRIYSRKSKRAIVTKRDVRTSTSGDIGGIKYKMIEVDHSVPGASGVIIETENGKLVYTGDIRFTGWHSEKSNEFIKEAKNPQLLITEGTRIRDDSTDEKMTEMEIKEEVVNTLSRYDGKFAMFISPPRDIERLYTMYLAAEECGRKLLLHPKIMYILYKYMKKYPDDYKIDAYLFQTKEGWGLIDEMNLINIDGKWVSADEKLHMDDYSRDWKKSIIQAMSEKKVTFKEISKSPGEYFIRLDYYSFQNLIDIKPNGGVCIKSYTEPLDPEMAVTEEKLNNWLKHFGIYHHGNPPERIHSSGHATAEEIFDLVEKINPDKVIFVHTEARRYLIEKKLNHAIFPDIERCIEV